MLKHLITGTFLSLATASVSAAEICDSYWFHLGGVSKHIQVYEPTPTTRFQRETHPGVGFECQNRYVTIASGEFTNSLDRPFYYMTASKDVYTKSYFKVFVGALAGEYGLTVREPLRVYSPVAYIETKYRNVGVNLFSLPPLKGFNDYTILFAQLKVGFQ